MATKYRFRSLAVVLAPMIVAAVPSFSAACSVQEPSNCKPRTCVVPPPAPVKCKEPIKKICIQDYISSYLVKLLR